MMVLATRPSWVSTSKPVESISSLPAGAKPRKICGLKRRALLGFFGGICAGAAYTMVRKLGEAGEKGPVIVLFFSVFSCVVVLPWLIFDYHPMTWQQMGILLLAGCVAAGGQFAITAAYRYAPASRISIYDYSQLIFSTMLGFFIFGQVPDGWSFLGYGIICLMAIFMFVYNNRKRKNTQKQALLESKVP